MLPKKASEHIKPTALELEVSEDLVQDITAFYWNEVRKAVVDLKSHNIYVENLGTFKIKHWKLDEVEQNYRLMIERLQKRQETGTVTFQRFSIMKDLQAQVDKIQGIRSGWQKDEDKKQQVKQKRNESKANMDTPEADL